MKLRPTHLVMLAAIVAGLAAPTAASAATDGYGPPTRRGHAPVAIGLTSTQSLVTFRVDEPARTRSLGAVSGLVGDTRIVGIDYRVQDRKLYGVGEQGGIYTFIGAAATKVSQLTAALSGQFFGVDFNPAADRLRIVSDTGQNLRHDVTLGTTITDAPLTYPPAVAAVAGVSAVAYTNNDLDPTTGTTLYDLDTVLDQAAVQSPANAGLLALTGKLGVDAGADAGFDIRSTVYQGKATAATGYAALSVGGRYRLYAVNLITGAARRIGTFPTSTQVSDIAVQLG
ncbi:hypothetical protein F4553_007713 [Allocatelliglobosispora scoriae]|uniref:DUF4394 domain-containing protein n=1 Tax=Allocatelliglobosispora scoriae TaxID=643052 RepID=A0A841C4Q5_9ACTN|nr:DUF4394 domain-containing protein [Allocatelliglobosispora scoriae]MBB5874279.1 hypothetical protein [Allocatelliglobosispora scoriae]